MNLLLIIAGAGLILAAGFILKGRKNQADRNARYRAPRTALKLDRASAGLGRSREQRSPLLAKARPPASPAAPIMLGVVLVVLSLWLAAAYLRPSAESAETGTAAVKAASPPPPPAQVGALAGRLSAEPEPQADPAAKQTSAAAAAPAAPPAGGALAAALSQAAAAQAGDESALSQVGLMPTRGQPPPPAAPAPAPKISPEPTSRPAAETGTQAGTGPLSPPAPPAPPQTNSNLVRALAGPPPSGISAPTPAGGGRSGILSGTEGFTVHLGSFVDQANAENFRAKLAAAGEPAAISEITMDGRHWYRVLSGRFETRTAADAHGRELRRRGLISDTGPFIVKPINSEN